jgi:hypothetical protein
MFEPTSRYAAIGTATFRTADGRDVVYKKRRFLPQGRRLPLVQEITVTQGDRLDLIAARTLGDPEQFWQICDANEAMHPAELTREAGRVLRITFPRLVAR